MVIKHLFFIVFILLFGCKTKSKVSIECHSKGFLFNCDDDYRSRDSLLFLPTYIDTFVTITFHNNTKSPIKISTQILVANDEYAKNVRSDYLIVKFYDENKRELFSKSGFYSPDPEFPNSIKDDSTLIYQTFLPKSSHQFEFRFKYPIISEFAFLRMSEHNCDNIRFVKFCIVHPHGFKGTAESNYIDVYHY